MTLQRRTLLQATAALGALGGLSLTGCASRTAALASLGSAHVVVVGGGYGGATAAKYIRMFSGGRVRVTLIEPQATFISCPMSNLVVGGVRQLTDLTVPYTALQQKHGVQVVADRVSHVDPTTREVLLAGGQKLKYDKLVLSPGIEMIWDHVAGLKAANDSGRILQAWKAGPETLALRRQLEAMPDGGVFAITIPEAPYRCPPGPYERASMVAHYFKQFKPRSKVLILDANADVTSKGPLFKKVWAEMYPGMVEYRPQHKAVSVDEKSLTVKFDVQEDVRASVLNVLPPMRAGAIAVTTGLATINNRWVGVNYQTFEAAKTPHVHVIGDAIQIAPLMPKSGHMANSHAKVAAAAIVAQLSDLEVNPAPMLTNTCYSYVSDRAVIHVASVHAYDAAEKTFKTVPGSGGVSAAANEVEAGYAWNWARTIWSDSLG